VVKKLFKNPFVFSVTLCLCGEMASDKPLLLPDVFIPNRRVCANILP
jgi:hypothetical protein